MSKDNIYSERKVLITGGMGFIGSNLAHELVRRNAKVLLVDSMVPEQGGNPANIDAIKDKVTVSISDIRDEAKMAELVKDQDFIFHLAARTSHTGSMTDPLGDLDNNCRGSMVLLESARKYSPNATIVHTGTRGQYGPLQYLPIDEKHPSNPADINGINKHAAEQYHLLYHRAYGMKTLSLRLTNVYGPRHQMKNRHQGVLNWFIRLAVDGETIKLFGDGSQKRDTNYVGDVVDALLLSAASEDAVGNAFNVGGNAVSLLEYVQLLLKVTRGGKYECVPYPNDSKIVEVGDYIANIDKIKKTVGWKPRTSLEDGLRLTVDYYKKYKKYYW